MVSEFALRTTSSGATQIYDSISFERSVYFGVGLSRIDRYVHFFCLSFYRKKYISKKESSFFRKSIPKGFSSLCFIICEIFLKNLVAFKPTGFLYLAISCEYGTLDLGTCSFQRFSTHYRPQESVRPKFLN